ncbi:hypothetical protein GCM10020331_010840 [Ectobacillus funiculus]
MKHTETGMVNNVSFGGLDMNKTDIINNVAEQVELTKKDATKAVDAVFDTIFSALKKLEIMFS